MFKVNQQVVCVTNNWYRLKKVWFFIFKRKAHVTPIKDEIYTVKDVYYHEIFKTTALVLKEIPSEHFGASGFLPLTSPGWAETISEKLLKEAQEEEIQIIEESIKI